MNRQFIATIITLTLTCPALAGTTPLDVLISGRKLVVKTEPAATKRRFLFKTVKDSAIIVLSDPTATGATLFAAGLACVNQDCAITASSGSVELPAANWIGLGNPAGSKGYRYKDRDLSAAGVKTVILKPGKLIIKAVGPNWPWAPVGGDTAVALTLQVGIGRYCAEFGGSEIINEPGRVSFRDAPSPAACIELCGNDFQEGAEVCDGADSASCSGICQSDCTCPAPVCGNGVTEIGEECDLGLAASALSSGLFFCNAQCQMCVNSLGCDFYPCCEPNTFCQPTVGGTGGLCTLSGGGGGLGDICSSDIRSPIPCETGLGCDDVFSGSDTGTCCTMGTNVEHSTQGILQACTGDADCCFPGTTCETGECCGLGCQVILGILDVSCCNGQTCLPDGSCCNDAGTGCSADIDCCSGSCDQGNGLCL